VCPACGATPDPATPPAAAPPGDPPASGDPGAHELEALYEGEYADEDEGIPPAPYAAAGGGSSAGRWRRRGNRIVLYGA
jgi:hypothetical protein